jgi:hypothetical protein
MMLSLQRIEVNKVETIHGDFFVLGSELNR